MLPLHLDWSAPLECPTGQQVEQELSRITRPRPGRVLVPLEARATITREGERYHLALQLTRNGEPSEAHFDSKVCAPLRKAATLVLALAYGDGVELQADPDAEEAPAGSPLPSPPPVTGPAPTPGAVAPPASPAPRTNDRARFTPWVGATLTSGFIGSSATGAEAGLTWGGRYLSALTRLSAFPPATAARNAGVSAQLSALTGALGACAAWPAAAITLQACFALEAGVLRASSSGAFVEGSATAPWLAFNPALALTLPISRPFALRAELGTLVAFDAPRFDVAPLGTLYGSSRLAPRASLGISAAL